MLDRAPLSSIPQSEVGTFYRHTKTMAMLVRQKENEYWFRLSPGTRGSLRHYAFLSSFFALLIPVLKEVDSTRSIKLNAGVKQY